VADDDAGSGNLLVNLIVSNGILQLATIAGLTGLSGDGTASVAFEGTLSEITAAMNPLTYTPNASVTGQDLLLIDIDDQGHTGWNGPQDANDFVTLTVAPAPTATPSGTSTDTPTQTPTETPTDTPTRTPTGTPTSTPTFTPTATPTVTPTPTPVGSRITNGAEPGSTRIFGTADPSLAQGCILICEKSDNNVLENCGGDDEPLGSGGADASGQFVEASTRGIGLNRPLEEDDVVCAFDQCETMRGSCVVVRGARPARALSGRALLLSIGLLGMVAWLSLVRSRRIRNVER
jgi:hypothetical protein